MRKNYLMHTDNYYECHKTIKILQKKNTLEHLSDANNNKHRNTEFKEKSCMIKLLLFKTSHILIYISRVVIKHKYLNSYLVCLKNTFV